MVRTDGCAVLNLMINMIRLNIYKENIIAQRNGEKNVILHFFTINDKLLLLQQKWEKWIFSILERIFCKHLIGESKHIVRMWISYSDIYYKTDITSAELLARSYGKVRNVYQFNMQHCDLFEEKRILLYICETIWLCK